MKMERKANHRERKNIRLKEYDYSQPGEYFVTICTKDREHRFGRIVKGRMSMNDHGTVVESCWKEIPKHYQNIGLDEFTVMPDHFHGIVMILEKSIVGATHASPQQGKRNRLGDVVGSFKSAATKRMNETSGTPGVSVWQRGYYDHIIRDEQSLDRIRDYIIDNPRRWSADGNNADATIEDECDRLMNPSTN
jgi:REP element-mobilizing transposase RayT